MEFVRYCLSAFHPDQKLKLIPFAMTTTVYLVQPYTHQSLIGVTFKILPMLSLILYVMMTKSQFPTQTRQVTMTTLIPRDTYSAYILAGLTMSMMADVLVTNRYVGLLGVVFFVIAHLLYVKGIENSGRHKDYKSSVNLLFILLFADIFLFVQGCLDGYLWKVIIFLYFIPLFLAAWKATAAYRDCSESKSRMIACVGGLLFVFSDVLIVLYHSRCYPIPFGVHIYMLAYYGAQFCWAVSTSDLRTERDILYQQ